MNRKVRIEKENPGLDQEVGTDSTLVGVFCLDKRTQKRRNQGKLEKKPCIELLDEFPIKLYKQEDQHYNPEGEEYQHTKQFVCPSPKVSNF